jgi:Cd2+/Zn2+-exporting ATPase
MDENKVALGLALPGDAEECEACIERLSTIMTQTRGIAAVHVERSEAGAGELCLHYDPSVLRLEDVRARVESAGAELLAKYDHIAVPITGLRHVRHARLVENAVARIPGVHHAAVSFGTRRLYAEFDPTVTERRALVDAMRGAGVEVSERTADEPIDGADARVKQDHQEHDHGGPFGARSELFFSLACGALTATGWVVTKTGAPIVVSTALFVLAYVAGSWFTFKEVALALRTRRFEIDFLMLLAAAGAAALGEWFEGALLLFLFTLGHSLEGFAMSRARKAIESLAELVPRTAVRLDPSGREEEVNVEHLRIGDRVLVKPNTRLAADGFVLAGTSSVNQAPITGESVPVDKRPVDDAQAAAQNPDRLPAEHRVFAGTINGTSVLTVVVTKAASDSTLARVVRLVSEAETGKSPTQRFTERFERVFVPAVVALVVALLFAGFVIDEPFARSFYRAMAVLVAASPCALAIATPSAVLSGVARAARGGVLIKGGAHLESLGLVRALAFDKTGTLTEGRPKLTDVLPCAGVSPSDLLQVAVAVERRSDHPLAQAVVEGGAAQLGAQPGRLDVSSVEAIVGHGVRAVVDGDEVLIGKVGLFDRSGDLSEEVRQSATALQTAGRTVMIVSRDDRFLGVLGVMDTPREAAKDVIVALHRLGIEQIIMLTGDNQSVADAVAKRVGIRDARGDLLPEQKVAAVIELASTAPVAMIGDGVNDAPAMAHATVGIAMGAGGSDVALESADIALMGDDLRSLPFAVGLSRAARRIILQNLWASLGMVAFLVPATIFGFAGIGVAVALHEGSTLLVVINALRLLAYRGQQ